MSTAAARVFLRMQVFAKLRHDGRQVRMFLGQRAIAVEVARDVLGTKQTVEFDQPCSQLVQFQGEDDFMMTLPTMTGNALAADDWNRVLPHVETRQEDPR